MWVQVVQTLRLPLRCKAIKGVHQKSTNPESVVDKEIYLSFFRGGPYVSVENIKGVYLTAGLPGTSVVMDHRSRVDVF